MKIAIYARVSSDTQAKEGTIDSQIEALKDYAKTHNLEIAYECLDDGYSGMTLDRPGLDQVRDLAQSGSIEGVLILAPDRLSRKQANQIIVMEEFKKRNIQVIFTNQNFGDTPEDKLMLQIQGAVSEYEREKILDRMRRGIIHATKKGQVIGINAPYGYRYVPKTKDTVARWEVNPEEAKKVQLIFNWYVHKGIKGTAIAKRLNDEAIHSRTAKWWSNQIYAILKNEAYKGMAYMFKTRKIEQKRTAKSKDYRKHKNSGTALRPREEWIGVPVTPIIDESTWNKAQELLKLNANRARRNNNVHEYLLRQLVVCGLCGSMASGYVSNKSTYYSCGAKRNKNLYSKPHDELIQVSQRQFDEKVWAGLTELLSDPENLKAQINKRLEAKKLNSPTNTPNNEIDQELDKLALQEKRILDAFREEVISLDELKAQKEKITSRRKVLEAKKKTAPSPTEGLGRSKITLDMLGDVSARYQRVMPKSDFLTREKIVNRLVTSVTLLTNKAIIRGNVPVDKLDALTMGRFAVSRFLFNDLIPNEALSFLNDVCSLTRPADINIRIQPGPLPVCRRDSLDKVPSFFF